MISEVYHAAENEYKNSALCGAKIDNMNSFISASVYASNCKECIELQKEREIKPKFKRRYKYR